ncbi:uncharacterized protein LOC110831124 isoform X2 [Zootermopsis nevadensis]|uniref:uncharacterized protein LOC110831124 isoform X2 n=1 Tax=Zootermopsis nevadensis TaxID=136037 RepID=UPI000B8E7393|nr:uncharacterized protein LOC110831124 isoform X2 [Zootermopsis nevadensis]
MARPRVADGGTASSQDRKLWQNSDANFRFRLAHSLFLPIMKWMDIIRSLHFIIAQFILLGTLPVISGDKDDDYEDIYNEQANCLPNLADKCFSDVYTNIACHLDPTAPKYCEKRDVKDLCSASADALSCAQDIIDTSCKAEEGRNEFDAWMQGLQGIYSSVCEENFDKLKMLLNTAKCWNVLSFLKCVEEGTKIGHIVDMLHSKLDLNRCSHLMIAMATCNSRATNPGRSCRSSQDIINEAIHAFFTQTKCGQLEICSFNSHSKLTAPVALAVGTLYMNFQLT